MQRVVRFLALLVLLLTGPVRAQDFLEPDKAFRFSASMVDGHTVAVSFQIADGYYMYREPFKFGATGAKLGAPAIPAGKVHYDPTFEKDVETYRKSVTITIPVDASGPFTLHVSGQGCSEKGLCYSPQDYTAQLTGSGAVPLPAAGKAATGAGATAAAPAATVANAATAPALPRQTAGGEGKPAAVSPGVTIYPIAPPTAEDIAPPPAPVAAAASTTASAPANDSGRLEAALKTGSLLAILPLFALLGLGLSFTPCVLPMVPILSSIIVGEGDRSNRKRGLLLSVTYALGMAIVYTALGVAAGLAGEGLSAALQNPWVLGSFGVLMVLLSLSMFGYYELQVPAALQSKLSTVSNRQSSGKLAGVFVMGAISALIVGPCVAAPLAAALVYISQTRDVFIGGSALFAMAVGMSVPLILVGASAGALLPRAGKWMDAVKRFFGVLMLAMALWLVSPVLPPVVQMMGWAALLVGYGAYLLLNSARWQGKALAVVAVALGLVQLGGVVTGGRDPLAPLAHVLGAPERHLQFQRIKTVAELDAMLAQTGGKTALLDFYADWCVSCKEMEKLTFVDPQVQARLANTLLLQVDVTANDADDKAMLKRFGLFGPPGIILFDAQGREIAGSRVIGYQNAAKFSQSLERLK
ncbi:protein-disulfide reductase [Duganella sp. Leaf126]|uniref:protein-disulfide reductase DsbD n=1 Tax=Duganella sp. Leaf126 TaxID=1736266 RepID=UPI0006FEF128|nr:protein-disulfide reductase DsbD [Duganella sp. Leaf126]KQQ47647.1 protein-disulfide reductase [Duganella sp. Leaf126]